ncbi:lysine methyltransferase 5Ab isoform X2 [Cynoglossus semilaevis]|uniref:[histone H4]-lysine(20) N-methyltransferase n=1 Tax=Cynoglossus semilaevis TaxID=244447 RepID=A0A3P8WDW2_CYNSE|nr:N-lysine methyltransferase KMT5A-like isoform X2 [Cynoglossus semilaevis]
MAKGSKNVQRTDVKTEDIAEHIVNSQKETKENKPAAKNKDYKGQIQSVLQIIRSPRKPRSPLSDSSIMLIQEGNESDVANVDVPKARREEQKAKEIKSESCDSKEQNQEILCQNHGTKVKEQITNQSDQKDSTIRMSQVGSGAEGKVSAPKSRNRTGQKPAAKKLENKASQNRKVTDYYPIRRSNRKTKAELKTEEHKHLDDLIKRGTEVGMQVKHIEGKGRGVFALKSFSKGEFVVEYHGNLLELAEAKVREAEYAQDPSTGCYMYYFQYQSRTYCVDATKETSRLGRLVNHSKSGNCQTRLHPIDGSPHLILVASRDIEAGEELLYDYGDRSKASISAHPWLKH